MIHTRTGIHPNTYRLAQIPTPHKHQTRTAINEDQEEITLYMKGALHGGTRDKSPKKGKTQTHYYPK